MSFCKADVDELIYVTDLSNETLVNTDDMHHPNLQLQFQ